MEFSPAAALFSKRSLSVPYLGSAVVDKSLCNHFKIVETRAEKEKGNKIVDKVFIECEIHLSWVFIL